MSNTKKYVRKYDKIEPSSNSITEEEETVPIRLLKALTVKTKGEVTGKEYTFIGAGSVVNVDKADVSSIMKRNTSYKSCCGSYSSPYFEVLGR